MRASSSSSLFQSPSSSSPPPAPSPSGMAPDQLPVVDLRSMSQTEIHALSSHSCRNNSYDPLRAALASDDSAAAATPKIDRSVFNESAGSRKQTYSRLRLAPHSASSKRHHHPNASSTSFTQLDPSAREHRQIISNLRRLFAREHPSFVLPALSPVPQPPRAPTLTLDAPQNGKETGVKEDHSKALVVVPNNDRDKEIVNAKGVAVNLAELAGKEDPYSEELRKRTAGLKSEPELLAFLGGLEGDWMSRRQRRRFVDAFAFGDHLPKGWKLLLGLKRKEGVPWVNCRRYVSPNGRHFETCKEVSLYIQSLLGISTAVATVSTNANGISLGDDKPSTLSFAVASHPMDNDNGPQECTKCNLSFEDKGKYLQHQLSFHQKSRKRRRNNNPVEDGALTKDGKYMCQFCNKTFDEKTRYVSHMEAHIRYQGLDADEKDSGTTPIAIEGPSIVEALKNEKNPKAETDSMVDNPENEQTVQIEVPSSIGKSTEENTNANKAHPSAESSKTDTASAIQTPLSVKNPITDKINGIEVPPSVKDPKIDKAVPIQSPFFVKVPLDSKVPASLPPLDSKVPASLPPFIEEANNDKSVSLPGPTSVKNSKNVQTPIAKAPIENFEKKRKPEATEIQVSSSRENPKNNSESITKLLEDGSVEMSEGKSLKTNDKGYGLTGRRVEEVVRGPLNDSSGASVALSGPVYQDGSAADGKTALAFDRSNLSQSCSPVSPDKDFEVKHNLENEHGTNNLVMNQEMVNSKTKEVEASELWNHEEAEPKNDIFDSTFTNASTCSLEASQQACPDIETFDLNNYGIVDDGSKPEDIIRATHRMLFESDTGAMSDETSFMDCDSVGEPKEVELAERPVTFSELLANANAHANATLAEANQTCQESESLDLNNNTSDRIDNNEVEYEVDKLATNNTTPSQTILTTPPTMDYNADLFASCFSANMNESNGVGGFDINSRDSLLEEWEKPNPGLESRFQNNSSGCEDIVNGGTGHNFMEMMTIQDNLEGYSSLMQSASTIPVANMMQDKLNNVGYQYQSQNNGAVPSFNGMRLAPPGPSGYVAMPSANNPLHFPMPQQTMMFGYVPPQMVGGMGLQLDWGLTTPTKMMMPPAPRQFTSVCMWCNREFRHDGSMAQQQQSESVGLICPSCKERFPGHSHLGL